MRACARGGNFVSEYNQKMSKREFFKLSESDFENKSLKYEKKWKTYVLSLYLDQTMKKIIKKKMPAPTIRGSFSWIIIK